MRKIRGLRWWIIALIMLGSIATYLTRSTLSVAAPTMLQSLHIATRQYSWIVAFFQGTIMLQPLCGYVLDVLGLKMGFALFATAWALVNMAHGLITMASDLFKKNEVATVAGMAGAFGNGGLLIFNLLIGSLVATPAGASEALP